MITHLKTLLDQLPSLNYCIIELKTHPLGNQEPFNAITLKNINNSSLSLRATSDKLAYIQKFKSSELISSLVLESDLKHFDICQRGEIIKDNVRSVKENRTYSYVKSVKDEESL